MNFPIFELGDLCDVSIGRTPPRNEFKWFNQETLSYKWVSIKDMGKSGKYICNTSETISIEGQKEFNIPIVPINTVILSFKLTIGRVAITGNELMLTNEAIAQLPIKDETLINKEYLYYYLKNFNYDTLGNTSSIATAVNSKTIKKLPVVVPPYKKQLEIVSVLIDLDKKIATSQEINSNLEEQAQTIFHNWFVDLTPFASLETYETECGVIPKKWKFGSASDFFEINIDKTPPRAESKWFKKIKDPNCNVWTSISDMGSCGMFISDSKEYLTDEAIKQFNVIMVPKGTVLLSFKLTIGRICIADEILTTNEAIARFVMPNDYYIPFVYLYLKQFKYGTLGSTSSIATAINSKIIKNMPFFMPDEQVIEQFYEVVNPLFELIKNRCQEIQTLSDLRDSLMAKLIPTFN